MAASVNEQADISPTRQRNTIVIEKTEKASQSVDNKKEARDSDNQATWGRNKHVFFWNWVAVSGLLFFAPLFVHYAVISMTEYDGSLYGPIKDIFFETDFKTFLTEKMIKPINKDGKMITGLYIYGLWLVFQAVLAVIVPGKKGYGQTTPAGHTLEYNVNGFNCYILTHIVYVLGSYYGAWSPTIIYDYWLQLAISMQLYGYVLSLFCFIKAKVAPTHPDDIKTSDSLFFDYFMGIELNPRIGPIDFKLFHNGRIGIVLWTLINLSCAAKQYEVHGTVTNSMIMVNIGHAFYVIDFFWNEDWYLRTIDICHDHFGFYLAWGDAVWLPIMYVLQAPYLVGNPHVLSVMEVISITLLFSIGYYIFRDVNNQKDLFRSSDGKALINKQKPTFINASYITADGSVRESKLLTSGWWGFARHFNYTADLMMSLSFCLVCGYENVLPYFYIFQMGVLLTSRIFRDEAKCLSKYGKFWDQYCTQVKWRLIPGVF